MASIPIFHKPCFKAKAWVGPVPSYLPLGLHLEQMATLPSSEERNQEFPDSCYLLTSSLPSHHSGRGVSLPAQHLVLDPCSAYHPPHSYKDFATSLISFLFYSRNPQVSPSFKPNKHQSNHNHYKARGFYLVSFGKEVFPYHHCHLGSLTTSWKLILPRTLIIVWLLNLMDVTSCFPFCGCGRRDPAADHSCPPTLPHLRPPHTMPHATQSSSSSPQGWQTLGFSSQPLPAPPFPSCFGVPGCLHCFLWVEPSSLKAQFGTDKKYLCSRL